MPFDADHPPRTARVRWASYALAAAVAGALPGAAQVGRVEVQVQVQVQVQAELPPDARETMQNVTVNDSSEARKDIETARGMERQREWNKAAGWYQEVLEKYRTRVVAWKANEHNVIDRYRGIVYQVQESLAKWPADGVNAYRARYESIAGELEKSAAPGDAAALKTVLDTYFLTEAAKTCALRLIDVHLEAAEFDAAARIGELLLEAYPADRLIVERPRVLFRTALAHHLGGDAKLAAARAAELTAKFPEATGQVFGKDVVLAEALAGLLKTAPALAQTLSPDSWPTFGGSPDRSRVSAAQGRMGARVYSIDLPARRPSRIQQANDRMSAERDEVEGRTLGIMPVVDAGSLFFQDGARVWAVGLDSGIPLPGWAQTYPGNDRKGVYQLRNAATSRGQQYTLTVTDTVVLAAMGQPSRMAQAQGFDVSAGDSPCKLVCLDRQTGKELWIASIAGDRVRDDERERLKSLDVSGAPVVVGDNVYIIGRGGKDAAFENCYVLCFDLSTGRYRWSCLVASANASPPYAADGSVVSATASHLAYAGGRLYVLTNLGALAAVDAANGSVVWLTLYPRDQALNDAEGMVRQNWAMRRGIAIPATSQYRPWELNPVFVQDGKLFVIPTDGKGLFVYDAASGRALRQVNLETFQPDSAGAGLPPPPDAPRTLAAVLGDRVVLVGAQHAYLIDWARFDSEKTFAQNHAEGAAFSTPVLTSGGGGAGGGFADRSQGSVRGRAFVTGDSVFVTTDRILGRLSIKGGLKFQETYPSNRQEWDEKEGPGNVLVTGEHVVIAGRNSIDVYTDMTLARAKLDREIAAQPEDPDARLHYAEVMFAAGQMPFSLAKMREAVGLLGGPNNMRPGAARQKLFNDALTFAQKLAREQRGDAIEAAIEFFDLAGRAADLPAEQVSYRLNRARFARANVQPDSFATAVRLYQEILARPDWRTVGTTPEGDDDAEVRPKVQTGAEAYAQIEEIKPAHPEAYAPVQRQAVAALASARGAGADPAALLEVAETFPNSAVAPQAMLFAAGAYETASNPRLAAHVLRQIYRRYGKTADKDQILESMARNYLTLPGGLDVALARLKRARNSGDSKLTGSLTLPDGTKLEGVTFRTVIERMTALRAGSGAAAAMRPADAAPPPPDVHVPPFRRLTEEERAAGQAFPKPFVNPAQEAHAVVVNDVAGLVQPPPEQRDAARPDRVVAMVGSSLALFAPGAEKPLGVCEAFTDVPRFAVWGRGADAQQVLFAWSGNEVVALDGDHAAVRWQASLAALPATELVPAAGMRNAEVTTDSVVDPNADDVQQQLQQRRIRQLPGNRRAFPRAIPNNAPELEAVPNGQEVIWHVRPLGSDRVIAGTSNGRVFCLDAATGKLLWQTRVSQSPLERLVASDDFTAVRVTEEKTARLVVLDNYNGEVLMVRRFAVDSGLTPVNLALSPDGMLVWTLPDRLCGKDLYEPNSPQPTFEYPKRDGAPTPAAAMGNQLFTGCNKPGQLVIRGDRIIALAQNGHFVSLHSLEDGSRWKTREGGEVEPLATAVVANSVGQPASADVTLRVAGNYVYAMSPRNVRAYHLDRPAELKWDGNTDQSLNPNFQTVVPTRDFLMVVGEPGGKMIVGNPARLYRLSFFSRLPFKDNPEGEKGRLDQVYDLSDPAGVTGWQAVDRGVYYVTGDKKLRFLRGARE